jgi:hypothetical protein
VVGRINQQLIELHGNLDRWITDDTSRFDSVEAINAANCSNHPIIKGCRHFNQIHLALVGW